MWNEHNAPFLGQHSSVKIKEGMSSYLKNAYCGKGPGETPSALRCLSYLISRFLTDTKQLAGVGGHSPSRLLMSMPEVFSVLFNFNKTLLHKGF